MENRSLVSFTDEQRRETDRQAEQLVLGLLGDESVGGGRLDELRRLARDPRTPLGCRVQRMRARLEELLAIEPKAYTWHHEVIESQDRQTPVEAPNQIAGGVRRGDAPRSNG